MVEAITGRHLMDITKDHNYSFDDAELRNIFLRDDIKDLHVAVISIVGVFRSGKSFLLNYFLRYLKASDASRRDGSWVGAPKEKLNGFSWRGGSERNTLGIIISDPFPFTTDTGEQIAVMLVDTQGTFDSSSTVRDNSTIFALSTLISSIQIYNIKENIKEDDLSNLQFFSEYAKLLTQEGQKPFQTLQFLVRDWYHDDEHAFGLNGGNELLEARLKITKDQQKELREVRENIRASFESVECFLMPHPGMIATKKRYDGEISGLSSDFVGLLKVLTNHLFGTSNLKLKKINGDLMTSSQLFTYVSKYMSLFNGNELPTPHSIAESTAEAGILIAESEARNFYEKSMREQCGEERPSMPVEALTRLHKESLENAQLMFTDKKKLGSKDLAKRHLDLLTKELEKRQTEYFLINKGKFLELMSASKDAYTNYIENMAKNNSLCVHAKDLLEVHKEAMKKATDYFDSKRITLYNIPDTEREGFLKKTSDENFMNIRTINEKNNNYAINDIVLEYRKAVTKLSNIDPPLNNNELKGKKKEAQDKAKQDFLAKRTRPNNYNEDYYLYKLNERFDEVNNELQVVFSSKNKIALERAIKNYDEYIAGVWDFKTCTLHPDDLSAENEKGKCEALKAFRANSNCAVGFDLTDTDEKNLVDVLNKHYKHLVEINDAGNNQAVQEAFQLYKNVRDNACAPSWWWLLVVPMVVTGVTCLVDKISNDAEKNALSKFYSVRRFQIRNETNDIYADNLKSLIAKY